MSEENTQLVACNSCSKLIDAEATYCSFCGKQQKKEKKGLPSQLRLFILNLMCPGAGDWALGEKLRATIFFLIIIGALVGYCVDVLPIIQKAVQKAVSTGNTAAVMNIEKQISGNGWMSLFTIAYIVSFIDSFFLLKKKQKNLEENKNG